MVGDSRQGPRQGFDAVLTDINNEKQAALPAKSWTFCRSPRSSAARRFDRSCGPTGQIVNLKKGQFLSPAEMGQVAAKARRARVKNYLLTERGDHLWLQQSSGRHALDSHHATLQFSGDFRRDPFGGKSPGGGGDKSSLLYCTGPRGLIAGRGPVPVQIHADRTIYHRRRPATAPNGSRRKSPENRGVA